MINIKVERNENSCAIFIEGHAGYAEHGKDIICAAVSTLYLHLMNSIAELTGAFGAEHLHDEAFLYCITNIDPVADAFITAFLQSCKSIAEENPEYVRYKDV